MESFFPHFFGSFSIEDASTILSWLLSDDRFDSSIWDSDAKSKYTERIKGLSGFSEARQFTKKTKETSYPSSIPHPKNLRPYALFSSNRSLGQDFIRHIRNGIAHGSVGCIENASTTYVVLTDRHGVDQTAFIQMPLSYIGDAFRIYSEMESALKPSLSLLEGQAK